MNTVTLIRYFDDGKQTLGNLSVNSFKAKTLELPWRDNKSNISCIPGGRYFCKWTRSNRLSAEAGKDVFTYEITGVPARAGIRIHSANYYFQLLGCIALGSELKDLNLDQELDVVHSGETVRNFAGIMNREDFILNIISYKPNA